MTFYENVMYKFRLLFKPPTNEALSKSYFVRLFVLCSKLAKKSSETEAEY